MKSLSVGQRLSILVIFFSVMLIGVGAMGLANSAKILAGLKTVYEDRTIALGQLSVVSRAILANHNDVLRAMQHHPNYDVSTIHDHGFELHQERIKANQQKIDKTWSAYMATFLTDEEKKLATDFEQRYRQFTEELVKPTMAAMAKGDFSHAVLERFIKGNRTVGAELEKASEALFELQVREAKSEYEKSLADYERTRTLAITLIALGLLSGMGFSWWLIRSVTGPLNAIRDAVVRVQETGDFTQTVAASGQDEVAQTARAFNDLIASMRSTLGGLLASIAQVSQAAADLADNSRQSADAASDTSESASSMAASVEQMTVSINHVADGTREALDLAQRAGQFALQGGNVIQKAVAEIDMIAETVRNISTTITHLGNHSERISGVVQVIKDVADQTNLLALNAAIEAARAGETGRGFAVVADEVRKLAERTATATGEIGQMITEIQGTARTAVSVMGQAVEQVDAGVQLAAEAGAAITEIRDSTTNVANVVSSISDSIVEQGSASHSIASQVERVAQAAEENSATALHSSEAASQMESLAGRMRDDASRFKI